MEEKNRENLLVVLATHKQQLLAAIKKQLTRLLKTGISNI
jgi:dsDNA-binding SOS-regulon protein